ncbi:MAG: hypothetical protein ACM4D3_24665 [Candidatus Sericytochromatia bacterium]
MDWEAGTSRPTVDQLVERTGLSERTVQRCRKWLREHGLLEELEPGSTPRYRDRYLRAVLGSRVGNRAALFRHAVPGEAPETVADLHVDEHVDETVTPSLDPCVARVQNAHAREARSPLRGVDGTVTPWELRRCAQTRFERLALAERLRAESPPARAAGSARRVRHALRPWLLAGWSVRDVLEALDHRPDGTSYGYAYRTHELRNPAGWLVHRLRAWLDATGNPLPARYAVTRSGDESSLDQEKISEGNVGAQTILMAAVCEHGDAVGLLSTGLPRCPLCRCGAGQGGTAEPA